MRLGIDIGGTKTAALVLDDVGRDRRARRGAVRSRGNTQVLGDGGGRRRPRGRRSSAGWAAHRATSAPACPGSSTRDTGWARHAVNLGVSSIDLAGGIEAATGRRPSVDNDVKAAALGAHHAVRPEVADGTTAYLNVGTGLAAAIVHRGRVVRGAGGAAGEIGHLPVGTGMPCSCGQEGCLETIASGTALHRMWPGAAADLFPAAAAGDERARARRRDARARHRPRRAGARRHRCRARRHRRWPRP